MPNIEDSSILVHQELEGAGSYVQGVASQIKEELDTLRARLQPLVETWAGQASTNYQDLQNEWDIAAAGLLGPEGVLGQVSQALSVNWANYSDAEGANVATWAHR